MWLIVGLGNPGSRYARTPHNLGFDVACLLASRWGAAWKASRLVSAQVAEATVAGEPVHLMMPSTFMNLSGEAAAPHARYYKVNPLHVLAVADDVAIPWGKLRLRTGGSHGGHNGLRNLILHLGTDQFPRVRVGCAPEGWPGSLADYVLAQLKGDALARAEHMAQVAADAVELAVKSGMAKAQNTYNGYTAP